MGTIDMRDKVTPNDGEGEAAPEETKQPDSKGEPEAEAEGETVEEEAAPPEEAPASNDAEEGKAPVEPEEKPKAELTPLEIEQQALAAIAQQKADLLKEVSDLRGTRRDLTGRGQPQPEKVLVDPNDKADDLSDIDQKDVALIERVIKAKGYAKREDLDAREYHGTVKSEQDRWLEEHPEYKPENDTKDERWNALKEIASMFQQPKNPKDVRRILDMANAELTKGTPATLPTKPKAEVAAAKEKIKVAGGASGAGSGSRAAKAAPKGNLDLSGLQGFTKEELAELSS